MTEQIPRVPGDALLYGRVFGLAAAIVWIAIGSLIVVPLAALALTILFGTIVYSWTAQATRGTTFTLTTTPIGLVIADLAITTLWMMATAADPRSVAFALVLIAAVLVQFRLGRLGTAVAGCAFLVAAAGQQLVLLALGLPVDPQSVFRLVIVVGMVLLVIGVVAAAYRDEQERGARALRRAHLLEQAATEIDAEAGADLVLGSIPRHALELVSADHATLNVHRGREFMIIAGAGLGERVVGVRGPATSGIVGRVVMTRATVTVDDYRKLTDAPKAVLDLGLRSAIAIPVLVQGEIAAVLNVGRCVVRPFDRDERDALEGFAAHAAIALANARRLELGKRREELARELASCTTEEVIARLAVEAERAFNAEYVAAAEITPARGIRVIAALGAASSLAGLSHDQVGPLLAKVIEQRAAMTVRDYANEYGDVGTEAALEAGIHAVVVVPVIVADVVVAVFMVGTTDPHRRFDVVDEQGLLDLAELAGSAIRAVTGRRERERRIQRLTALNEIASKTALVHEPQQIASFAHESARSLVEFDAFYVARYDGERRLFDFLIEVDGGHVREGEFFLPLGAGPTSQVVLSGEPYVTTSRDDAVQKRGKTYGDESRRCASAVHMPLKIRGEIIGVVSVQSYRPAAYDAEDVAILQSFSNLVASSFENAEHHARLRELYLASVKALAAAVDARDPYTRSHSARVAALSRIIAVEMQLPPDEIRRVQLSALLHDIGKIGIPDAILNKPAALTTEEWVIMKTHAPLGASILAAVEPLADLVPIVHAHHERFDGAGYPDGLAGDAIPLGAYIVSAADAYEVIVSKRAYKAAQSVDFAVAELRRCSGTQFHPDVVAAFIRVIERDRREGSVYLSKVGAIEHEDIDDVPGPGSLVERMAEHSHTHARQLAILQRLASEISAVLDLNELTSRLLRIVCDAMGYENGFLTTLNDDGELSIRAAFGPSTAFIGQSLPSGTGISWWVMEHGRLQNVADVHSDTRFVGPADIRSSLIVPLRIGDETVGIIGIESTRPAAFSSEDETLLTATSHQVAAAVRVARLHQAAKSAAATDPLTGLPNRRAFFDQLAEHLAKSERDGAPLSVAMIDANGLKQLNDQYGHASGDQALIRIGELLAAGVRQHDVVARIGGDEFAIVFPGAPLFAADRIMRRLALDIADATIPSGQPVPTIAWGIAPALVEGTSVDALVDAADRAMYRQKQLGRARAG
ncbi:MAG TPA: GAF domain-containing protein [Candidatus Saccharimonadales bacterium]|nr:GAF domain-containing protein [Candidatus Saccharimonadales bacterium]